MSGSGWRWVRTGQLYRSSAACARAATTHIHVDISVRVGPCLLQCAAVAPPPSPLRALLQLAWPIVLARATQSVIGFTDALMVAPLGEAQLAAVTTGSMNIFTAIILPMGLVFILQGFAAQLRGRGDLGALPRYAYYGLAISAAAGLLGLLAIPLVPPLLALVGYAPQVESSMGTYLQWRLLAVAAAIGAEALGNWYSGLGNTRPALVAGIVAMVVNVLLNHLLIEPRYGLPGYGVAGAAWASVVASWLGFTVLLVGLLRGAGYRRVAGPLGLRMDELRRVLRFGLPNGVNWFLEFGAFALFINVVIGHLGTTVLAAFNVVMQVNSLSFMPAFGIASAGAIQAGEAIGRGQRSEVNAIVWRTVRVTAGWMVPVGCCYLLAPAAILRLFESDPGAGSSLVEVGSFMLTLSAMWQLFDAVGITVSEALRAAGDTTWCMYARIVLAWFVFTPLSWAAVMLWGGGVATVMLALVAYLALLAIAFTLRFLSGRWRDIDMVGAEAPLV